MTEILTRLTTAVADRYDVEREVGAGGMATVYLVRDVRHRRAVAIKVLRPELAAVIGGERFLREIETAARLNPPHILPLYDSGQADGRPFYVMPFIEGESLRHRLEPVWARQGRELFYRSGDTLWSASIRTGPPFAVGVRRALFAGQYALLLNHANYDVHPDGQRFLMLKTGDQASELVLVLNWFEELRRRTGRETPR